MGTTPSGTISAADPSPHPLQGTLQRIREVIWKRRPILGEIMQRHGGKILYDYTKDFLDVNRIPRLDADRREVIECVRELTAARLGSDVANAVAAQLMALPLVSTADHHAPIDHPFWVNANLISAIPSIDRDDINLPYLVVFSFSSVSLNNASGYPRGIQFYGGVNGSKNILRVPILPDKHKMSVVYATRAFTAEDLSRTDALIRERVKQGEITPERSDGVRQMLADHFGNQDVLSAPDLSSQITKINHALWPLLFHPADGEKASGKQMPGLLYLEIETIVTAMLQKRHLTDKKSLIWKSLFHPTFQPLIWEHFNNIPGAFSHEKDWGTYFFWYIDDKGHRVRLYRKGDQLVSKQGMHTVPFTPEGIAEALKKKEIFPSMLLCYLMISLYYGFKCLGGFCQVNDLTMTKKAWQNVLNAAGYPEEAVAIEQLQTKELGGDGMVLAYTRTVDGDLIPGSGIDMLLSKSDTQVENYIERSRHVTLSEMMDPMLPEMYTVLYPSTERDPAYTSVSPEQILKATGLGEKLDRGFTS